MIICFINELQDELHRLIAENEAAMEMRKSEFEAELELKRKLAEDDRSFQQEIPSETG